jgi:hypothetical protein
MKSKFLIERRKCDICAILVRVDMICAFGGLGYQVVFPLNQTKSYAMKDIALLRIEFAWTLCARSLPSFVPKRVR